MKVGNIVRVKTKFYGVKTGIVIEKIEDSYGESWVVMAHDHPRNIVADARDLTEVR